MSRLYEDVVDGYGIKRRMSKSRDGTKWFGSISFVDPDTGKEEPMWITLPSDVVRLANSEKAA